MLLWWLWRLARTRSFSRAGWIGSKKQIETFTYRMNMNGTNEEKTYAFFCVLQHRQQQSSSSRDAGLALTHTHTHTQTYTQEYAAETMERAVSRQVNEWGNGHWNVWTQAMYRSRRHKALPLCPSDFTPFGRCLLFNVFNLSLPEYNVYLGCVYLCVLRSSLSQKSTMRTISQ